MPIEALVNALQQIALTITVASGATALVAYVASWLIQSSPIPFKDWKASAVDMRTDAIKSVFMISLFSLISSLATYVVSVIALAK